jgi:glutamyl-tRNA reductase
MVDINSKRREKCQIAGEIKLVELDKLKEIVHKHLSTELDIMEMIIGLDENSAKQFYDWFSAHPYRKGIGEIKDIIRQKRANRQT